MRKLLFQQVPNYLRTLGFWQQVQIGLIALALYLFLSSRLGLWFDQLNLHHWQIALWIFGGFVFLNAISAPFVFKYALPRQKAFQVFQTLPLPGKQVDQVLAVYYFKVQIPLILLQLIFISGLIYVSPFAGLTLLFVSVLCGYLIFIVMVRIWSARSGGLHLESVNPTAHKSFRKKKKTKERPPAFGLFRKELLSLWRNPRYRRLKIFTFVFYLSTLMILFYAPLKANDMWMMFFSIAVFWMHYNVHFNSKYVSAEPEWFFRTLPVKFYRTWLSRFFAEFLYVTILLLAQWLFLALVGIDFGTQLHWIGALLLFAAIILTIVLNFQILFYDNPRLAGYAYHFTILFIVVSSINFQLVGPLSAIFLLAYFTFITRRFYTS